MGEIMTDIDQKGHRGQTDHKGQTEIGGPESGRKLHQGAAIMMISEHLEFIAKVSVKRDSFGEG